MALNKCILGIADTGTGFSGGPEIAVVECDCSEKRTPKLQKDCSSYYSTEPKNRMNNYTIQQNFTNFWTLKL